MDDKPVTKKELIEILKAQTEGLKQWTKEELAEALKAQTEGLKQYIEERIEKSEIKSANGFLEMGERIMAVDLKVDAVEERLGTRIDHVENNLGRRIDGLIEGKIKFERER